MESSAPNLTFLLIKNNIIGGVPNLRTSCKLTVLMANKNYVEAVDWKTLTNSAVHPNLSTAALQTNTIKEKYEWIKERTK